MAAMLTDLRFSFTAHAKDIYSAALNPSGLLPRKLLAARFAVTCTEANRRYLQDLAPDATIYRIYHGVNVDFTRFLADPVALSPRPAESDLRLLSVGRLVEKKGFDIFVEACHRLQQQHIAFTATIVGEDGNHGNAIRQQVAALGLSSVVRFTGPLRQDQLFAEYQRASLFCLPCRVLDDGDRDGIPNVLLEAMACGLPVITTNISGIPELVTDTVDGLLIPPEDPGALAEAILRLHHDPVQAHRLAARGKKTACEQFDGDQQAAQLAALFQHVCYEDNIQKSSLAAAHSYLRA
jgi:glycosyltransferase involved in cell wall biosynthesis